MNVTVSLWYVPSCHECVTECDRISKAAVRDHTVTKLTLSAGHRHNHPEAQRSALPKSAAAAAPTTSTTVSHDPPSGDLFGSDTMGSGPADTTPNGFDTSG
jgi:hypothetical protein